MFRFVSIGVDRDIRVAINLSCLAGLMLACTFLPWGRVPAESAVEKFLVGNEVSGAALSLFGSAVTVPISGWIGSIKLGSFELPNWMPLLGFAAATASAWLKATRVTLVPLFVLVVILGYALLHMGCAFIAIREAEKSSLGPGLFLSILAIVLALVALAPQDLGGVESGG